MFVYFVDLVNISENIDDHLSDLEKFVQGIKQM